MAYNSINQNPTPIENLQIGKFYSNTPNDCQYPRLTFGKYFMGIYHPYTHYYSVNEIAISKWSFCEYNI